MIPRPPSSPLSPYPPLSRSEISHGPPHRAPPFHLSRGRPPIDADRHTLQIPRFGYRVVTTRSPDRDFPRPPRSSFAPGRQRSEEHTSELQSQSNLVCRLLLE